VVGQLYDYNGNQLTASTVSGYLGYDAENRLLTAPGVLYAYDVQNKRIWKGTFDTNQNLTGQELYFYGVDGQKLGTYTLVDSYSLYNPTTLSAVSGYPSSTSLAVYFGGKRVAVGGVAFVPDRLGSKGKYYPYGEERNSPLLDNDQVKFASYTRDSATGLDYADQRYYASNFGRFMSPDPYKASGGQSDPRSWNRYSYVQGDPINYQDRHGLSTEQPGYCDIYPSDPNCSALPYGPGDPGLLIVDPGEPQDGGGDAAATNWYQAMLDALDSILGKDKHCNKDVTDQFGTEPGHGSIEQMRSKVGEVQWYDTTLPGVGGLPLSSAVPGAAPGQGKTLSDFIGKDLAGIPYVMNRSSIELSKFIVIGSVYFGFQGLAGPVYTSVNLQQTTLTHEMLHIYTGKNDKDLAAALGLQLNNGYDASTAIRKYLTSDCTIKEFGK
jgi:RHS repeat-associated protein